MFGWNGTLPFPLLRRVADVINPLMNWLKINERIDYKLPFFSDAENALPSDICAAGDMKAFRQAVKTHYFSLAFSVF